MKKLILTILVILSITMQQVKAQDTYSRDCSNNQVQRLSYIKKNQNLVPKSFQEEEIFFSDENSMRSGKIVGIEIEKTGFGDSILTIQIELSKNKPINQTLLYLNIKDRSVKNYGSIYGFKLINSSSSYDEEIYIKIENSSMELWFQTLLEGFSGKKFTERVDPKE